jgi:hypothetical protein
MAGGPTGKARPGHRHDAHRGRISVAAARVVLNLRIHRHTAQRPTPPASRTPSTHALVIRVHDRIVRVLG